jgi:diaminopimelate epimerase
VIVPFHKYHALGNDFIVIHKRLSKLAPVRMASFVRAICGRHSGVGADGVIVYDVIRGKYHMRIFNADGGEAEISGNGLRILAHHIYSCAEVKKKSFGIESTHGSNAIRIIRGASEELTSSVTIGAANFQARNVPMKVREEFFIRQPFKTASGELLGTAVNVGNPHIVFFVDNFEFDWRAFGREVEVEKRFPQRTNVEFAVVKTRKRIEHRIWERGVGETSASGTGAASTVAAGIINGLLDGQVTVQEPAGNLVINIAALDQPIIITGPSRYICTGGYWFERNAKNNR